MSRFKGNYFHFLPRTGKGRKTSKLPVSHGGRQASTWAVDRHIPSLPLLQPPHPHRCLTELIRPRTNAFHSLSREEGACHGRINHDPSLVPALPAGSHHSSTLEPPLSWLPDPCLLGSASLRQTLPLTFHAGARTSAPVWPETPTSGLGLPTLQAGKLQNQKMKSYIFPFLDFSIISLLLYLPNPPPPPSHPRQ